MLCATTMPSTLTTLSRAGAPAATWRSAPAPVEPCSRTRSPSRANSIGTAQGSSPTTVHSVPARTVSRTWSSRARSEGARSGLRRTAVGTEAGTVAGPVEGRAEDVVTGPSHR